MLRALDFLTSSSIANDIKALAKVSPTSCRASSLLDLNTVVAMRSEISYTASGWARMTSRQRSMRFAWNLARSASSASLGMASFPLGAASSAAGSAASWPVAADEGPLASWLSGGWLGWLGCSGVSRSGLLDPSADESSFSAAWPRSPSPGSCRSGSGAASNTMAPGGNIDVNGPGTASLESSGVRLKASSGGTGFEGLPRLPCELRSSLRPAPGVLVPDRLLLEQAFRCT